MATSIVNLFLLVPIPHSRQVANWLWKVRKRNTIKTAFQALDTNDLRGGAKVDNIAGTRGAPQHWEAFTTFWSHAGSWTAAISTTHFLQPRDRPGPVLFASCIMSLCQTSSTKIIDISVFTVGVSWDKTVGTTYVENAFSHFYANWGEIGRGKRGGEWSSGFL